VQLGPLHGPDLGRDLLDGSGQDGERGEIFGVPVAVEHLAAGRRGVQSQPRAHRGLDLWWVVDERPDFTGQFADALATEPR